MSLVWIAPPVILVLGLIMFTLVVRSIDDARGDLRDQLQALGEVRRAVATVRAEAADTRATLEALHRR